MFWICIERCKCSSEKNILWPWHLLKWKVSVDHAILSYTVPCYRKEASWSAGKRTSHDVCFPDKDWRIYSQPWTQTSDTVAYRQREYKMAFSWPQIRTYHPAIGWLLFLADLPGSHCGRSRRSQSKWCQSLLLQLTDALSPQMLQLLTLPWQ